MASPWRRAFFAVAPIAVHVRADVGAVATMGGSPYKDANEILDWLEEGETPEGVIERLRDRYGDQWGGGQINIVDVQGRSISATGTESMWKGQRYGKNYATSGNILAGPEVVDGFADTFERTEGSGMPLAERLLAALAAADRAGGDARGRMGATLVVKKKRPEVSVRKTPTTTLTFGSTTAPEQSTTSRISTTGGGPSETRSPDFGSWGKAEAKT